MGAAWALCQQPGSLARFSTRDEVEVEDLDVCGKVSPSPSGSSRLNGPGSGKGGWS